MSSGRIIRMVPGVKIGSRTRSTTVVKISRYQILTVEQKCVPINLEGSYDGCQIKP